MGRHYDSDDSGIDLGDSGPRPTYVERSRKRWWEKVTEWLLSQGTSTVLLILLALTVVIFVDFSLKTALPKHLESIQMGYERIEASHEKQIKLIMETMREMNRFGK